MGIAPASATQEAHTQLLSLETKHLFVIMVVESPQWRPRSLLIPPTPFIGREAELAEIAELLANPNCRFLTILGPGGMGKSRLALQTAVGHQTIFADGIAYASLASLDSSEFIVQALAEALNFTLASSPDPTSQLLNFLHQKEILLVLDNFEQLLDSVWVLAEILAQVSEAKILITSRQWLGLQEEWVFAVHGLPLPDECDDKGAEEDSSVLLFLHNVRRSRHSFMLTEANRAAIVRICHLVDGLPLGLELAASWVHSLSCAEIANEIERELDFLTVSTRNIAERQGSIRTVFDYSWQLLSPVEQQILKRLSLLDTSFSREIVETVAGVSPVQLLSLVDKSLIHRTDKIDTICLNCSGGL
ncbi:MAG: hypothetical protein IPM53_20410 [Anaerolineaceae bacterium]|nr:hypothetical protein [Anaerolineaceae bacterium]